MLETALLVGLAALFLWYLLAESTILNKPMGWPREHLPLLIGCAWCCGFWLVALLLVITGDYHPLTHLAAAGFVGFVGSKA